MFPPLGRYRYLAVSGGRRRAQGFLIWALVMETVLIVEDGAATRDALMELLGKEGREIVTAGDGEEALERLIEVSRPRVILLDLMMARMDGWEFLPRESSDPSIAKIPTILLSGLQAASRSKAPIDQTCRR
jgi:CheY-like chemotaxis protein